MEKPQQTIAAYSGGLQSLQKDLQVPGAAGIERSALQRLLDVGCDSLPSELCLDQPLCQKQSPHRTILRLGVCFGGLIR